MNSSGQQQPAASQSGMVLLLCLIFLTALTLLGLSASGDTRLQSKLAGNLQETERTKQATLAALSWAEQWLLDLDGPAPDSCNDRCKGLYLHPTDDLPSNPEFQSRSWWMEQGQVAGIDPLTGNRVTPLAAGSTQSPLWIIETLQSVPPAENGTPDLQVWYRILVRGQGQTNAVVSVIESILVRSWPTGGNNQSQGDDTSFNCPGSAPGAKCGRVAWRELL